MPISKAYNPKAVARASNAYKRSKTRQTNARIHTIHTRKTREKDTITASAQTQQAKRAHTQKDTNSSPTTPHGDPIRPRWEAAPMPASLPLLSLVRLTAGRATRTPLTLTIPS